MDFIVELIRSAFTYLIYVAVALVGVFAGTSLRKWKNKKNAQK